MRGRPARGRRGKAGRFAAVALACLLALATWLALSREGSVQGQWIPGTDQGDGQGTPGAGDVSGDGSPLDEGTEGGSAAALSQLEDGRHETDTGYVEQETLEGELPEVATGVVEGYRDQGSCVLVRSGYLDMFGKVWSCTVSGDCWVDTCLVSEGEGACVVLTVRMEAERMPLSGILAAEGS